MTFSILLVDNDPVFLALCCEFLESKGFGVVTAVSAPQALQTITHTHIHLAILDMRLNDQDDEKDRGGLLLAKSLPAALPKLILTNFPTYRDVVDALKPAVSQSALAVDYVDKRDGLEVLHEKVLEAVEKYVPLNQALTIQWQLFTPAQLLQSIDLDLEGEALAARTAELEDLLRLLFQNKQQITLDALMVKKDGYVVLKVVVFDEMGIPAQFMVTCGLAQPVHEVWRNYQTAITPRTRYPEQTRLVEMSFLAAIAYAWVGGEETAVFPIRNNTTSNHIPPTGLWIDEANQITWVDGQQIDLTSQEFQILYYLYQHTGHLCERQAIVEKGLGEIYDPYDPEQSRLNSAISRLRRKIEPDPQTPRYLITVRARGYRLEN
jgi:DNA-binding response OmpR family regulator